MNHFNIYTKFLPIMIIPSTFIGFATGIHLNTTKTFHSSFDIFSNWIGYTSLGIMSGFMYPVSFPMLAGYVVYKNH